MKEWWFGGGGGYMVGTCSWCWTVGDRQTCGHWVMGDGWWTVDDGWWIMGDGSIQLQLSFMDSWG